MLDSVMPYVLALVPTIGVATLFYFVIKSILEGDRRERLAQARWEAEHRKAAGAPQPTRGGDDSERFEEFEGSADSEDATDRSGSAQS